MYDYGFTDDFMGPLFSQCMSYWEILEIENYRKSNIETSFEHIGRVTTNLKLFKVTIRNWVSPASLRAICQANLGLQTFHIQFLNVIRHHAWRFADSIKNYLESFEGCKILRYINLSFANACNSYHEELIKIPVPCRNLPLRVYIGFPKGYLMNKNNAMIWKKD